MARITTITPNYSHAFSQEVETAIAKAKMEADKTNTKQVVFEGPAYCWYGFMSAEEWRKAGDDELCEVQVIQPREAENTKKKEVVKRIEEMNLSMKQLEKLETFLASMS